MKALIFAAGLGTRLRPLTDDRPKALVEVCGRSLLEWNILKLYSYGFADIVINVHHFGKMVEQAVQDFMQREPHENLKISFSEEFDLLRDTGGGIRHAREFLEDGEPFLVHNVDILSDLELDAFYSSCCQKMKEDPEVVSCVLVSGRYSDRRLLFDRDMRLKGWENIVTHQVKSPFEDIVSLDGKPEASQVLEQMGLMPFAFGGVHVVSPKVFELMEAWEEKFPIVDFYLSNASSHKISGIYEDGIELLDVGRLSHLPMAEEFLKRQFE